MFSDLRNLSQRSKYHWFFRPKVSSRNKKKTQFVHISCGNWTNQNCRILWKVVFRSVWKLKILSPESKFNEFEPRRWTANQQLKLSASSNIKTLIKISSWTNHVWTASSRGLNYFNSDFELRFFKKIINFIF